MAKKRTKGDPIVIRLSLAADAELRRRAAEREESRQEWVVRVLEKALSDRSR